MIQIGWEEVRRKGGKRFYHVTMKNNGLDDKTYSTLIEGLKSKAIKYDKDGDHFTLERTYDNRLLLSSYFYYNESKKPNGTGKEVDLPGIHAKRNNE